MFGLIGSVVKQGIGFFQQRQELKHERKVQQIKGDREWENQAVKGNDIPEILWTVAFIWPFYLIPAGVLFGKESWIQGTQAAIETLGDLPQWWLGGASILISAAVGVRGFKLKKAMDKRAKSE